MPNFLLSIANILSKSINQLINRHFQSRLPHESVFLCFTVIPSVLCTMFYKILFARHKLSHNSDKKERYSLSIGKIFKPPRIQGILRVHFLCSTAKINGGISCRSVSFIFTPFDRKISINGTNPWIAEIWRTVLPSLSFA